MRLYLSVLGAIVLTAGSLQAGDFAGSAKGGAAAKFLTLGVNARALAMGEAYTAVADEASAAYWNPAALTRVEKRSATLMHASYLDSSSFDYAAYAHNLGAYGAIGADVKYFSAGKIAELDAAGNETGSFRPYDVAAGLAYAVRLPQGLSLGLGARLIRSKIIDSADGFAADAGVLTPAYGERELRFALAAANLGSRVKFKEASEDLPLVIRAGSSIRPAKPWILSAELGFPKDDEAFAAVGSELKLIDDEGLGLSGRAGFNSRTLKDVDGFSAMSFGVGLSRQKAQLDYAVLPFGSLGLTHRVSVSLQF